ncbi:MAG: hypothetical protein ACOC9Q_01810 [bacterium]
MAQPVSERPALPQPPRDERGLIGWALTLMRSLFQVLQQHGRAINETVQVDGSRSMDNPLPLQSVEAADLPDAADWEGAIIYVSDGSSGAKFRGSDGTNWVDLG